MTFHSSFLIFISDSAIGMNAYEFLHPLLHLGHRLVPFPKFNREMAKAIFVAWSYLPSIAVALGCDNNRQNPCTMQFVTIVAAVRWHLIAACVPNANLGLSVWLKIKNAGNRISCTSE